MGCDLQGINQRKQLNIEPYKSYKFEKCLNLYDLYGKLIIHFFGIKTSHHVATNPNQLFPILPKHAVE